MQNLSLLSINLPNLLILFNCNTTSKIMPNILSSILIEKVLSSLEGSIFKVLMKWHLFSIKLDFHPSSILEELLLENLSSDLPTGKLTLLKSLLLTNLHQANPFPSTTNSCKTLIILNMLASIVIVKRKKEAVLPW